MPSTPFPHVFLTRFNLPANRREQAIFSQEWLADRVHLFEMYTVPSVRAQGEEDVMWIIYLDHKTPSWLRTKMDRLEVEGLAQPVYLDQPLSPQQIKDHIREVIPGAPGPVTTSNLDNDDGLASDYVRRIRALLPEEYPAAVYLSDGLIRSPTDIYLRTDPVNAFVAVVDDLRVSEFLTCWSRYHNEIGLIMPAVRRGGQPAWLQVVHGQNVSNRVGGRLTRPGPYAHLFPGLLDDVLDPSARDRAWDLVSRPARAARDTVLRPAAAVLRHTIGQRRYESLRLTLGRVRGRRSAGSTATEISPDGSRRAGPAGEV